MADRSGDTRLMPVLAGLLLLALGSAAWLIYSQSSSAVKGVTGADALVQIKAANVAARRAAGGIATWSTLEGLSANLAAVKTTSYTAEQKQTLAEARAAIDTILENRSQVSSIQKAIERMSELVPGFSDGIYGLQGALTVQQQPIALTQLERLRLLANTIERLCAQLPIRDVSETLLEREVELQQVVRSLQNGDPELGITALGQGDTEAAINALVRRANQIGAAVRDCLAANEGLVALRDATSALDGALLAAKLETVGLSSGLPGPLADLGEAWVINVSLLGLAAALSLIMLFIWVRGSGSREETARLVAQSEKDQQAILQLLDELDSLADGDLTVQATVTENITGAIADSFNYAVEALRDLVSTIKQGAITLEDSTRQTEKSARALAASSQAQGRQVKDASAAVRQMAASIDEVSGNAERSSDVARHSVDVAHKGGEAVRRTIEGMNTIRETIQDTSKRIKRLGESSQEIGDIVELINDIADQTNILALNASIQASMAGEAGRGFAVVADEVQRLAERSANATKQIEVLVSTIQSDTNEAVVSMERSTTDVVGGALLAENAGAALEEIEQVSNQIAMLVQNISGSAKEQADDARIVLEAVEKLQALSGETDTTAASTAKYITQLTELASQLRETASGFTLPGATSKASAPDAEAGEPEEPEEEPEPGAEAQAAEAQAGGELAADRNPA